MVSSKQKPKQVLTAIKLLWASLLIGILRSSLEASNNLNSIKDSGFGPGFFIFTTLFAFAFLVFFIYMIDKGKNWARITFLVLFVLGLFFAVPTLIKSLEFNFFSGFLGVCQAGIQIIALFLLFQKPSSRWFDRK